MSQPDRLTNAKMTANAQIGLAQLKPEAVTGMVCGQTKDHVSILMVWFSEAQLDLQLQKNDQVPYVTASVLHSTPHRPKLKSAGGSVSGLLILLHNTEPIDMV